MATDKNTLSEKKNILGRINYRLDTGEENISELENSRIEIV